MASEPRDQSLEEFLARLPPDLRAEVVDFASFLLERRVGGPARALRFDWAGALAGLRSRYTSVELQHAMRDLWG